MKLNKVPNIRQAQPKDEESIRLLLSSFELPLDGLENSKTWVFLGTDENIVQGVAGLEVWGNQGLLRSVAVKRNLQNRGRGSSLVKHAVNEAKKEGIRELFLLTTTAPDFFRKLGFKKYDREHLTGSINNSVEIRSACPKTAILMHRKLA